LRDERSPFFDGVDGTMEASGKANGKVRGWIAFAALCIIWGTSWLAAGTLAGQIPPFYAAGARSLLCVLLLLPVILWKRMEWPRGRALRAVLILSVAMIVLPLALLVWAERHLSPATTAVLFAATPLLVGALTPGFEGRQVPRRAMMGMLFGLAGIAIATDGGLSFAQAGGATAVFLAVMCIAASSIYAKQELGHTNPLVSTVLLFASAAAFFALASLGMERGQRVEWNSYTIGSLFFLGGLAGAVGFPLYLWLLREQEAYQVVTVQWCEPLVGMLESALLSHESISLPRVVGSVVTLGSLIVVMRARFSGDDPIKLEVTE
jgi:drug/metabolite transporter (DMT)-like permease